MKNFIYKHYFSDKMVKILPNRSREKQSERDGDISQTQSNKKENDFVTIYSVRILCYREVKEALSKVGVFECTL